VTVCWGFKVFLPVSDQVQMALELLSKNRREEVSIEPTPIVSESSSINDLPDEILLKILSHFGPEELIFSLADVCQKWNALTRDVTIWKKACYSCDYNSDISRISKVRCAALLGFRSN
jgi:hypothetical protein